MKCTKIFDLTDGNNTECDGETKLPFDSEWEAMPTKGTNCHQCLELVWESDTVPHCVCFKIKNNQHDHNHHQHQTNQPNHL